MKYALLVLLAFVSFASAADTPTRVSDGKVEFAIGTVNGIPVYTNAEKTAEIAAVEAKGGTAVFTAIIPVSAEVTLSTVVAVNSLAEFQEMKTKAGLIKQMLILKPAYELCLDLGDAPCARELRARYNYLKQTYQNLP